MRSTNSNNNSHRQHSSYSSSSSSSSSSSQQAHSSYSSGGGSSNVGSSSQSFVMTMATDTLVLRGSIPPGYTYDGMRDIVKVYGPVESVRIIRDRLTGESKGYSFAIFATAREAHNFLAATGGCLRLPDGETSLTMEYVRSEPRHKSMPGSSHTSETSSTTTTNTTQKSHYGYQPHPKRTNWICPVCKIDNFARRDVCYKCNFPRPTQPDTEQGSSKDKDKDKHTTSNSNEKAQPTSTQPMQSENEEKSIYDDSVTYTTTICVRGLSSETDERALVRFFSHIAPVKAIRLARDKDSGYSRGFCHIEFYCIDDADGAVKMTNCTVIEKDGFPVKVALAASGSPTSRPSEECLGVPSGTLAFRYTGGPVQLIDTEGNFVYGNSFANTTATTDQAALEAWINYANDLKKYIEASQETQTSETTATTTATENKEIAENKGTEEKNAKESTTSAADITDNNGNEIKESEEDIDASLDEFFKDLNGTVENISTISAAPVKNETQVTDTNTATTVTATTTTTNNNNNDNDNNNSNSTDNSNCETSLNTDRTEGENEINFESTVDPIGHLIPDTVCILCMRQLPSVEALQRHIELSRLHKVE